MGFRKLVVDGVNGPEIIDNPKHLTKAAANGTK